MAGRDTNEKKEARGEVFPRERNGYSVSAVNEYIERMNRKFEDTLYDYRRQITDLKRDLEEKSAISPESIDKLLEQLSDANSELEEASAQIEVLVAERDALQQQLAELSAEVERLRAPVEHSGSYDDDVEPIFEPDPIHETGIKGQLDVMEENPVEPVIEILPYDDRDELEFTAVKGESDAADDSIICWPSLDGACYVKSDDDELVPDEGEAEIYEITPSADSHVIPVDTVHSAESRAEEIIAEARAAAEKILEEANSEARQLRANHLIKTNEEARAIKREAYLRAKLMLDRISRKLQSQFDGYFSDFTQAGYQAQRDIVDTLIKLRVSLDDLSYTASDRANQIIEEFKENASDG